MIVSRSCSMQPQSPTIGGTVLKESDDLDINWEWHLILRCLLRSIFARFTEQLLWGLASWGLLHHRLLLVRCFRGFVRTVLMRCSAVCAAADIHLNCWTNWSQCSIANSEPANSELPISVATHLQFTLLSWTCLYLNLIVIRSSIT